ncbi:zinc knuckle CX2CX4HX4C containing protein [Tanacetum coccineum]
MVIAISNLEGEGYIRENITIEYEWTPPRCANCRIFGHNSEHCPKLVPTKSTNRVEVQADGFQVPVSKMSSPNKHMEASRILLIMGSLKLRIRFFIFFTPQKKAHNPFSVLETDARDMEGNNSAKTQGTNSTANEGAKNRASTSNVASTSKGGNMSSKARENTVADIGKSYERVDEDSESDVDEVYDESARFMASGSGGTRNASVLEDEDYDMYEGYKDDIYDLTEEQKAFCKALDIALRGQIR